MSQDQPSNSQVKASRQPAANAERVIAIDLGSNSFHLLEATVDAQGRLLPLQAEVSKVQLGLDLDEHGLTAAAMQRGLDCVQGFAVHCRELAAGQVRIVGTQALRQAANREEFLVQVQKLLGHPVEIISGEDEARLAYRGVAADSGDADGLLVLDIGGGSTEIVAGQGGEIQQLASLRLGCVSWLRYFPDGQITAAAFSAARQAARAVIDPVAARFQGDWRATGCSGTLLAVGEVLQRQGWAESGISWPGLQQLQEALLSFSHIDAVRFQGLSEDRRSIFASGTAIVMALFESLHLQQMTLSNFGLREGVAASLLACDPVQS